MEELVLDGEPLGVTECPVWSNHPASYSRTGCGGRRGYQETGALWILTRSPKVQRHCYRLSETPLLEVKDNPPSPPQLLATYLYVANNLWQTTESINPLLLIIVGREPLETGIILLVEWHLVLNVVSFIQQQWIGTIPIVPPNVKVEFQRLSDVLTLLNFLKKRLTSVNVCVPIVIGSNTRSNSSVVECLLYTEGVGGSNPSSSMSTFYYYQWRTIATLQIRSSTMILPTG